MYQRRTHVLLAGLLLVAASGCRGVPSPPVPVNADLVSHEPPRETTDASADAIVVGVFRQFEPYASRVRGGWEYTWHRVAYAVLATERGSWSAPEVSFVFDVVWPTPESGVILEALEHPFHPGNVSAFFLDTRSRPPRIVATEGRSRIPPFEPAMRSKATTTEESLELTRRLDGLVRRFAAGRGKPPPPPGPYQVEEYERYYLVDYLAAYLPAWSGGSATFRVDKATGVVEDVAPPVPPGGAALPMK